MHFGLVVFGIFGFLEFRQRLISEGELAREPAGIVSSADRTLERMPGPIHNTHAALLADGMLTCGRHALLRSSGRVLAGVGFETDRTLYHIYIDEVYFELVG